MIFIALGRFVQFLFLLLTLRLATTFLPPEEMGKISLVTATVGGFALLWVNPVGMFLNRRLHAWVRDGKAISYLNYFWLYIFFASILSISIIFVLIKFEIWNVSLSLALLISLVFLYLIFGTVNQVSIPSLNLLGDAKKFIVLTVLTNAVSLFFAFIFVIYYQRNAGYWLFGIVLGQAIIGIIGLNLLLRKVKLAEPVLKNNAKISFGKIFLLASFAWPIAISVGLGWIQSQGYRYLMEDYLGLSYLGLFAAGYGISAGLMAGFESIFTTYFQPKFYERISQEDRNERMAAWQEYAKAILPSLLLAGGLIVASAPELTKLLLGPAYADSYKFVIWGALAECARLATAVFGLFAHAKMNTRALLLPSAIGAFCAIGLIYFLMPIYGAVGVGMGLALSGVLALIALVFSIRIYSQINFIWGALIKSGFFGFFLFLFSEGLRVIWASDNYMYSLVRIVLIGVIFLFFEYVILRPSLGNTFSRP